MEKNLDLDLADFPKELELLLTLMKSKRENNNLPTVYKESLAAINWSIFLNFVMHHRVFPTIHKVLKQNGSELIPYNIIQTLNSEYQKNTFRMLYLAGETELIAKLFAGNDINTLFLKGPVLSLRLYGDISLRTSADLDVLIPINQLVKAEQILISQGYVKDDYIVTVLNDWKWRHHHLSFFHPIKRVKVELHWRLHPGPSIEPNFNELWRNRIAINLTKQEVNMLGNEDLFLFLVSHGARHGWSRLRWLEDIAQLAKQNINWEKTNNILKKYECSQIGGQALILSSQLLGTLISKEMKPLMKGTRPSKLAEEALFYIMNIINLHKEPVPKAVAIYHRHHMFSLMSSKQKLLFILSFLYPYPEDAEILPLPKKLHILYFPLRPFLWIWRKTRKKEIA